MAHGVPSHAGRGENRGSGGARRLWSRLSIVGVSCVLLLGVSVPGASSAAEDPSPYSAAGAQRLLASPNAALLSGAGETALRHIAGQLRPARVAASGGPASPSIIIPPGPANVQVNSTDASAPTCATQSEAMILDAGAGKVVSAFNNSKLACTTGDFTGYSVSTDGGVTWTDKSPPPNPAGQTSSGDPVLAKDRSANVYLSMLTSTGIGVAKMTSGTTTFATWVDADPGTTGFADKEWMATGPDPTVARDNLYLAWIDFGLLNARFRMSRSIDGGATFQSLPNFTFGCNSCQGMFLVTDSNTGKLYAFWEQGLGGARSIGMRSSTDGGGTWSAITTVTSVTDSTPDSACGRESFNFGAGANQAVRSNEFPSAAWAPPNRLGVTWQDGRSGTSDIWAVQSSNGGATWSASFRVNTNVGGDQFFPSLAVDSRGAHFQWYSGDRATNQVTLQARSYLRVGGWQAETQISSVAFPVQQTNPNIDSVVANCYWSDYNQDAANGTVTRYIWGDTRNVIGGANQPDVFTAQQ